MPGPFLKAAKRNLLRNKGYTLLNVLGLSAGLTCFTFIALWVMHESSYDRFNKNLDRIVRVTGIAKTETGISESAVTSVPMAQALKNDYPEVENTVRMDMNNDAIVAHKGEQVLQTGILFTDPSFFEVFSYKLKEGSVQNALSAPYSIILTESTAKKYFGDRNPMGETLTMFLYDSASAGANFTVTGVIADPPVNAHFSFNILGSFSTVIAADPGLLTVDGWGDASYYTYLLLKEGVDIEAFSGKISQFYAKYIGDRFQVWKDIYFYKLQRVKDIHLKSRLQYEIAPTGNIKQVYIFSTIGIFILLLAGINYMNLATARSVSRAKEVGIKKAVGAGRKQLFLQFQAESILTTFMALAVALIASTLLQPAFFQLTGKDIHPLSSWSLIGLLVIISFVLGILAGVYPSLVISGFKPSSVLKGPFKSSSKGLWLRKSLVVAQFTVTVILVTGIIIVNAQLKFINNKDLGYNKETLLFIRVNGNTNVTSNYEAFRNDLLSKPLINGIATSNSMIIAGLGSGGATTVDGKGTPLEVNTARLRVDKDYLSTYGIKMIAGSNLPDKPIPDSVQPVLLNETAVKNFGWNDLQDAIGKPFRIGNQPGLVTGVVKDFHFNSLQQLITPLAMMPLRSGFSRITIKAEVSKIPETIAWVNQVWKKHFPGALFDYRIVDEQIGEQYEAEQRFAKIFFYFSILSLLIACLGLYGLISHAVAQRTKEIGIRKIIGASVSNIVYMLSGNFLRLVIIAMLIAIPAAWYVMNRWLEDFAYRTTISAWMFAVSGLAVIVLAFGAISFQVIKAAVSNPVKSLRTE